MAGGPPATSFLFNMLIKQHLPADPRDTAGSVSDHRKEANIERKQVTWIFISQLIKKLCAPYRVCVRSVAQSSPTPPYRVRVCVCVLSCSVKSNSLWPHGLQPARLLCPPPSSRLCLDSCSLSRCCYQTISSSASPFSSCPQSFPASGSFLMSWLFASGDQSIGASASASVLSKNTKGWFPLGLAGLISLCVIDLKMPLFQFSCFWRALSLDIPFWVEESFLPTL